MIFQTPKPITDQEVAQLMPTNIKVTTVEVILPERVVKDNEVTIMKFKVTEHDYAQ